ncbi:MAG: glucosaminidase domain-containing protein [Acidobacteriota bacterium]|jgi:uncharacterized FlgJ-related protein
MKRRTIFTSLLVAFLFLGCGGTPEDAAPGDLADEGARGAADGAASAGERESRELAISGYQDILDLFEELNYTPEAWQAGIREVPRVYLTAVGDRWREQTVKEITVLLKKRLFFRALAPLVLRSNERILQERERLGRIRESGSSPGDAAWLSELAMRYDVAETADQAITPEMLDELWVRVDVIPVSLALSQAAEESGWGTSRFAGQGNALFGQWTWGEHGMAPDKQRQELGNYGIAAFETPFQSVVAYMLNLNTHAAYADLRARRAAARKRGEEPTGRDLALGLSRYSERGEGYVRSLHALMEFNRLEPADDAYLSDGPAIYLVPATAPAD